LHLLASRLAGGQFVSGESIGADLGVTRATVSALVETLREAGMEIYSVPGKGHRAAFPFSVLDEAAIRGGLSAHASQSVSGIDVRFTVDSTNAELQRRSRDLSRGHVLLAEGQTAGRGRRGRHWSSPLGASLYLSLFWRFGAAVSQLGGLSLAIGVAVARAAAAAGASGVGVKWPNDVVWAGRKLGGILIEVGGEIAGSAHAIIGVGLNVQMPARAGEAIDQPWADIATAGGHCDRNRLAAHLINELASALTRFEQGGLEPFLDEWRSLDVLAGREVKVLLPEGTVLGTCCGIDQSGTLLVETGGQLRQFAYGDVSLRPART
jgi:BirA family biotin operon repressor/biotin-[acetyl-CoA-carboxylase] ligase